MKTFTTTTSAQDVNLSVSANTGNEVNGTVITITATASAAVSGDETVDLAVSGTGITGTDYTLNNTTITILNGQATGTVTFTVQNDADIEGAETAILTISNPSVGVTLGTTITKNIAITDDVMTTGATMNEIAKVLKQAGAEKVYAWSIARTPYTLK